MRDGPHHCMPPTAATQNPRRAGEADFFSRYALKLSPDDPEVKQIRAEFIKAEAAQQP